jgi:hypothetical protein
MRFAAFLSGPARDHDGAQRPNLMTFSEIIEREDQNTDSIWLYREGMFMKAYKRSAFFAHTLIHGSTENIGWQNLMSDRYQHRLLGGRPSRPSRPDQQSGSSGQRICRSWCLCRISSPPTA